MSAWETTEMAAALPEANAGVGTSTEPVAEQKNPQEHGWAAKSGYDYATYNKTSRELAEARDADVTGETEAVAVGGVGHNDWASNGAKYEWNEDYGDVGPKFPALEEQLFGSQNHVRTGIDFKKITELAVSQEGTIRIDPIRKFENAGLHPVMLENVALAGYTIPTPIQQYCLPAIAKGHDIVACAQTGSGKTAAFLIPTLSKLMGKAKKLTAPRPNPVTYQPGITPPVRAEPLILIVCPSRELATQIFDEARRFCYRTMLRPCVIYGGGPMAEQFGQLARGCDVLIGTPGRLVDFIGRPLVLTLKRLRYMIIDEADEMLQTDWETELKLIMSGGDQEEGNITYMMFSATFPKIARDIAKAHLAHDHVRIRVGRAGSTMDNITQIVVYTEPAMKRQALFDLLLSAPPVRTIVFVNSKRAADELDDFLFNKELPTTTIHSDRTQREREDAIRAFRSGKTPILIATGVSARGLDINGVMHVINYDLPSPQYGGIEEYTHRIGRTGRIGNHGLATSFYNDRDSDIAETLVKTLLETKQPIPDFLDQYLPEGFTPDGEGDITKLKFDADSDDEAEGEGEASGNTGGGWAASSDDAAPATSGWGASASTPAEPTPAASGWAAGGGGEAW
ncbi:hypothetical protein B7494_g5508 [Chlorociboria aeruginascens]|nr:hypothetical protein B7494_g5508 [Chlorociboria aeruginascens]